MDRRRHNINDDDVFGRRILRFLVIFSCFFALLSGVACLAIGIWIVIEKLQVEQAVGSLFVYSAYILIAVGAVIVIVSLLGCFGAARRSKCVLLVYFIFLLILFLIVLIAGILGFLFVDMITKRGDNDDTVINTIKQSYGETTKWGRLITDTWDYIQSTYTCCGYTSDKGNDFQLWETSKWFEKHETFPAARVPSSCCTTCEHLLTQINCTNNGVRDEKHKIACDKCPISSQDYVDLKMCQAKSSDVLLVWPKDLTDFIYLDPCKPKLESDMTDVGTVLGALGVGVAALLIIAMIIALCLYRMV